MNEQIELVWGDALKCEALASLLKKEGRRLVSTAVSILWLGCLVMGQSASAAVAPAIVNQPSNQVVAIGEPISLSVAVSGTGPFAYQWFGNGAVIPGGTNDSLNIPTAATSDSGVYYVVITNVGGLTISRSVTVQAGAPQLLVWGWNSNGQLGDGTVTDRHTPESVASNVVAVAGGYQHSLFLKGDGTLWSMGYNDVGQLGDGTSTERHSPVAVLGGTNVVAVAAGSSHSLFVKGDGTLWGAGYNAVAQLGDGTLIDRSTAVSIASNVVAVAAGFHHSLFLMTNGTLWAMGTNDSGQLGDGTTTLRKTPVLITNNVVAVAAGRDFSLFVKSDGTLWGMGDNSAGQLGDGSTTDRRSPILVTNNVAAAGAGQYHTFFLKRDHTVWVIGDNAYGQLGNGNTTDSHAPIFVATNVVAAGANRNNTVFLKNDGSLWATGENTYGELANGTTTDSHVPVQIAGMSLVSVFREPSAYQVLEVGVPLPPVITNQPAGLTLWLGSNATFSVTAGGFAPLTYQWYFNGTAISGATATNYNLTALTADKAGSYTVVVSNPGNSVTSSVAVLNVTKYTPTVTAWPAASAITYGQTLSSAVLSGGSASVSGSFAFTIPTTAPEAGTALQQVTFTPANSATYYSVTGAVSVAVDKASPEVTAWPEASTITYGQTLADSTLSGGVASVPGTFAFTTPATSPGAGTALQGVTFTPADTANYYTVAGSLSVMVGRALPVVTTWPAASVITYGQTLASSTLTGGSASVSGTFAFAAATTSPGAGTASQAVTFTPADALNYAAVSGVVNVTVDKATPSVTAWPTASAISYGQTLAASTLTGGSGSVPGTFGFTTPASTPSAGTASQAVTFTPTDDANYNTVSGTVSVTVSKVTPSVTAWPTASEIAYGQTLASSTLSGGVASVAGTYAFTTPGTAPAVGTASQPVRFTPSDTNYNTVSGSVAVTVAKGTPIVNTWPTASPISYGQTLASSSLSGASVSVSGSWAFVAPATAPAPGVSAQGVVFNPSVPANYNAVTGTVNVTVNKLHPTITAWPSASGSFGQPLGTLTLVGGSASVPGSFAFNAPDATPSVGTSSQSVTFYPTDSTNYSTVSGSASVTVTARTTTLYVGNYAMLTNGIANCANGVTIVLTNNILLGAVVPLSGKGLIIEGNNYTITVPVPGLSPSGLTNTGPSTFRVFSVSAAGKTNTIQNVTIKGGNPAGNGGAIEVNGGGTLVLQGVTICQSGGNAGSGGGLVNNSGTVLMRDCNISRNGANYGGGFLNFSKMCIERCTFSENRSLSAAGGGGAGENQGMLYVNNSTFANNKSTELGGALNNVAGTNYIVDCTFVGNMAYGSYAGGAIANHMGCSAYLVSSLFAYNYRNNGGAYVLNDLDNSLSTLVAYYCIFQSTTSALGSGSISTTLYPGDISGTNDSLFAGGAPAKVLGANGLPVGSGTLYQPFLEKVGQSQTPTAVLRPGSFSFGKGTRVAFSSAPATPAVGYYNGSTWVALSGATPASYEVTTDQNGAGRGGSNTVGSVVATASGVFKLTVNAATGGTVSGGTIYGDIYPAGTTVPLTAIPNAGYGFTRWDFVSGGTGTASTDNPCAVVLTTNITLIPVFSSFTGVTVSYSGNGATGGTVPPAQVLTSGGSTNIADPGDLGKSGCVFGAWNTSPDGTGTDYAPGATYGGSTNLSLYARWVFIPVSPFITMQPTNQTAFGGSTVTLSAAADGTALLAYQWTQNGTNVSGATAASYTLSGLTAAKAGSYAVVVTNLYGSATSDVAVLTVLFPPAITVQPVSKFVTSGMSVSFGATVTGDAPLTYQWYFNNATIDGATDTNYTLAAAVATNAGSYVLVVTNLYGCVTSSVATLSVGKATPLVTTWPTASDITYGQTLAASTLNNGAASVDGVFAFTAPATAPAAGTASQSVRFTPADSANYNAVNGTASVTVNKAAPTVSSWPAASTITYGQTLAASTLSGGSASVAGTFAFTAPGTVPPAGTAFPGVTFIPADAANYNTVNGNASVTVNKATPAVTAWPTASAIAYGQTLASSTLTGGLASVPGAFVFTAPATVPDAGTALQSVTFRPDDSASYDAVTGSASVTVIEGPVITGEPTNQVVTAGESVSLNVSASGDAPLSYQWYFNGSPAEGGTSSHYNLSAATTNDAGSYVVVVTNPGGSATSQVAVLSVNLTASLTLNSSLNPCGYKDAITFTASVTPTNAPGTIQFILNGAELEPDVVTNGASVSLTPAPLARGTNVIVAIYSGGGLYLPATNTLRQVVTNHPPEAMAGSYPVSPVPTYKIRVADLATNWTDADGDVVTLTAVNASTNGAAVTIGGKYIYYSNPNRVADEFTYTISDGEGGTGIGVVYFQASAPGFDTNRTLNITGVHRNGDGTVTVGFAGIPGYTYCVQAATNPAAPVWVSLGTNVAGTNGLWNFTDSDAAAYPQRFYRTCKP